MADSSDVITTLNNLIETCKDRQAGYQTAADGVKNRDLKSLFQSYARQSGSYADELTQEVRRRGGDPEQRGSVAGWFFRGWMNVKAVIAGGSEGSVVAECERGEDSARSNYENALKENLPADIRAVIQRQYAGIREGHDRTRALEVAASGRT
ncbi:MAG TPA: PA2169 family four-helix-bundle protein [Gemmataceae bacterium]|nr:PA2169 family four-helix-bundle protein [Gemmataceae bacterium]